MPAPARERKCVISCSTRSSFLLVPLARSSLRPLLLRFSSCFLLFLFQLPFVSFCDDGSSSRLPPETRLTLVHHGQGSRRSRARLRVLQDKHAAPSADPWPRAQCTRRTEHHTVSLDDRSHRQGSFDVRVQELHAALPASSDISNFAPPSTRMALPLTAACFTSFFKIDPSAPLFPKRPHALFRYGIHCGLPDSCTNSTATISASPMCPDLVDSQSLKSIASSTHARWTRFYSTLAYPPLLVLHEFRHPFLRHFY